MWGGVCVCECCIFFHAFPRAHRHPASTKYNFFFTLSLSLFLTLISCCFAWDRTYHPPKFCVLFFFYMHFFLLFCATQIFFQLGFVVVVVIFFMLSVCVFVHPSQSYLLVLKLLYFCTFSYESHWRMMGQKYEIMKKKKKLGEWMKEMRR